MELFSRNGDLEAGDLKISESSIARILAGNLHTCKLNVS